MNSLSNNHVKIQLLRSMNKLNLNISPTIRSMLCLHIQNLFNLGISIIPEVEFVTKLEECSYYSSKYNNDIRFYSSSTIQIVRVDGWEFEITLLQMKYGNSDSKIIILFKDPELRLKQNAS